MSRSTRLVLAFLVALVPTGLGATLYVRLVAAPELESLPTQLVLVFLLTCVATALHLFLRFMRWQYVL